MDTIIEGINKYITANLLSPEEAIDLLLDVSEWCSDNIEMIEEKL